MNLTGFKTLMTIKGVLTLLFAVTMLILPGQLFSIFGIVFQAGGVLITRLFGAAFIIIGLQIYYGRNAKVSKELRSNMFSAAIGDTIALIVIVSAQLADVMNQLGWLLVITYIFSGSLFTYFFFATVKATR